MNLGQAQGLSALSQSISKDDANEKNMQYMQQLHASKKADDLEREQAQLQEQQYYEMLNQQAEGLLAGDKEKINQKALQLQAAAKEQMKLYGGDRKLFLKSGGHNMLKGYIDQVAGSKEMGVYKANKENMVRIMDAQQKGMGSLILDRDLESMQAYQKNGEGEITYSGLMQEIDMPDANNYDLNVDIPLSDIVNHEANRMKILANYKQYYPEDNDVTNDDLMAFASKMGYGGKGSNRDAIKFARDLVMKGLANKKATAATDSGKKQNAYVKTMVVRNLIDANQTIDQLYGDYSKPANYFEDNRAENSEIANMTGKWGHRGKKVDLNEVGIDFVNTQFSGLINDSAELAHAASLYGSTAPVIASKILGQEIINGEVEIDPSDSSFYNPKGIQMKGDYAVEPGKYKGKMKFLGISNAMIGTDEKTGKEQLLMNYYSDEETYDAEATKELMDGIVGKDRAGKAQRGQVMAFQHPDGYLFYKRISDDDATATDIINTLGDSAWMEDYQGAQQSEKVDINEANDRLAIQEEKLKQNLSVIDDTLQSNASFRLEARDFAKNGQPEFNRSGLMKSFYASLTQDPVSMADQMMFSQIVASAGPEFEETIKNFDTTIPEESLIDLWLQKVNHLETPDRIANNNQLAINWKQSLKNYKANY